MKRNLSISFVLFFIFTSALFFWEKALITAVFQEDDLLPTLKAIISLRYSHDETIKVSNNKWIYRIEVVHQFKEDHSRQDTWRLTNLLASGYFINITKEVIRVVESRMLTRKYVVIVMDEYYLLSEDLKEENGLDFLKTNNIQHRIVDSNVYVRHDQLSRLKK